MKPTLCSRQRARITVVIGVTVALAATGVATAYANGWFSGPAHDFSVVADSFTGHGTVSGNVLRNDRGATAVVRSTQPGNGTVTVNADGTFTYTPNSGFTGADTFTYTATDAVQLFKDATAKGGTLKPHRRGRRDRAAAPPRSPARAIGSSLTPVPGKSGYLYGLTDRGPNADAPVGNKSEMLLNFMPQIGEFKLVDGKAELQKTITLKGPRSLRAARTYSGRPPHGHHRGDRRRQRDQRHVSRDGSVTPPAGAQRSRTDTTPKVWWRCPTGHSGSRTSTAPTSRTSTPTGYELGRLDPDQEQPEQPLPQDHRVPAR